MTSSAADLQIGFVMMNPLNNSNVGGGTQVTLRPMFTKDSSVSATTNSEGVVTFTISNEIYELDWTCGPCFLGTGPKAATTYIVEPQPDGTVQVLSTMGQPVTQDSKGNWILTTETRTTSSNSPWTLLKSQPPLNGIEPHLMFLLTDGRVLVQLGPNGSNLSQWWTLTPDAKGDYVNGTWKHVASPTNYNPTTFNGAVLHNGNVFVFGGEQNMTDNGVTSDGTNMCEEFDPQTNTWTEISPPFNGQGDWKAIPATPNAELPNGDLLIGAGVEGTGANESVLYDPTTNSWSETGLNKIAQNSEAGYTLLQNNKVLSVDTNAAPGQGPSIAEIYDPATGQWSSGGTTNTLFNYTEIGPALGLPNGNVLQTGALGTNGLYNLQTNTWSTVPSLPRLPNGLQLVAQDNEAVNLPNGNILTLTATYIHNPVTGNGIAAGHSEPPAEYIEYDYRTNSWIPVPEDLLNLPSVSAPNNTFFLPLPNGQTLVGEGGGFEIFTSTGTPDPSWLPVVSSVSSSTLSPSTKYSLSGQQLAGLTQGQQWGDEWEAATNYPLVRIVNNTTGQSVYGFSNNFSSTSIAPMTPSTFDFTLPSNVQDGPSKLYVIASGIASQPVPVTIKGGVVVSTPVVQTVMPVVKTIVCAKGKV